jgi:ectoine hydroxylase-related dioxygenase (phytanoyl-CoA dioxygenase family)
MTDETIARTRRGWHAEVPPNGRTGPVTAAHGRLDDPSVAGWTRAYDDPNVVARREHLRAHNGMAGLEIVEPHDLERAAALFHRDGFVVVRDVLDAAHLARLRAAVDRAIDALAAVDPDLGMGGGAGQMPHRYSFGASSATRHMLHVAEWCELIDLPTTTPLLTQIFGSAEYCCLGGGGDVVMPGAVEYQPLHSDNLWRELHDPVGGVSMRDLPPPLVTVNFCLVDFTRENGPIRQIPGTQRSRAPIPTLAEEPEWMKLSTVCPVPAGAAIFRDNRAWHGGTPNVSLDARPMPNIEYVAPWFRSEFVTRCMPYERWRPLSRHARRICRYLVADDGTPVVGAGFVHPWKHERDAAKDRALAAMDPDAAAEWLDRL